MIPRILTVQHNLGMTLVTVEITRRRYGNGLVEVLLNSKGEIVDTRFLRGALCAA